MLSMGWKACPFLSIHNRMGKTRDLFKKIRYTKRTFHANMIMIKDRKGGFMLMYGKNQYNIVK